VFLLCLLLAHCSIWLFCCGYFFGRPMPNIALAVLPYGPMSLESIGASGFIFGVTLLGMACLLPDGPRKLFIRRAPVVLGLFGCAYLALLAATFLLLFIPITGPLLGPGDSEFLSTVLVVRFHWHHTPVPLFPPEYCLVGCLFYAVIVVLLCLLVVRRRRRKAAGLPH
jgi:hypothetical protein